MFHKIDHHDKNRLYLTKTELTPTENCAATAIHNSKQNQCLSSSYFNISLDICTFITLCLVKHSAS